MYFLIFLREYEKDLSIICFITFIYNYYNLLVLKANKYHKKLENK